MIVAVITLSGSFTSSSTVEMGSVMESTPAAKTTEVGAWPSIIDPVSDTSTDTVNVSVTGPLLASVKVVVSPSITSGVDPENVTSRSSGSVGSPATGSLSTIASSRAGG